MPAATASVAAPATAEAAPKPKGKKKLLIIIVAAVLLLAAVAAGGLWFLKQRNAVDDDGEDMANAAQEAPATVPTFLPLENMIVNLADPGGEKFAQIGITLQVDDAKAADKIKTYLPSIRSGILVLVSQRTSEELLGREGKEKLANDILVEVSRPLGYAVPGAAAAADKKKPAKEGADAKPQKVAKGEPNPVRKVLFSSFIVQ